MKKIYFLFIFAVLASMTSAFAATVTIWSEDFSSNSLDGYTTVGSGTKLYTEALAGGTSPEILIAKSGGFSDCHDCRHERMYRTFGFDIQDK